VGANASADLCIKLTNKRDSRKPTKVGKYFQHHIKIEFSMKNLFFIAAFLFAALNIQAQDLNTEMNELGNTWKAALERNDAVALAALHAEKVDIVSAKDGSVKTYTNTEVETNWKKSFETKSYTIEFAATNSSMLADGKANFKGDFTQTTTDKKTGEKQVFNGTFDHQAVKVGGKWKLCLMKSVPKK
jgi:ketosteroid isomerase-like protein